MARPADPRKAAAWERRLQRFTAAGTTASEFCDHEGVSISALQYWRRRLGARQHERIASPETPVFQPVDLVSQQTVTIRFAGGVMKIPGDRYDLIRVAISAMSAEPEPC